MDAEIVSVGTELLLGQIVDTNAVYLSQRMAQIGIALYHRSTVGDNPERLRTTLSMALSRADLIVTIGGLGPTEDDLTKELAADVLQVPLAADPLHEDWLHQRFSTQSANALPASFLKQALVPVQGQGLLNPTGTALGAVFISGPKIIICLPGPPGELIPMWEQSAEPFLSKYLHGQTQVIQSRILRIIGLGESLVEEQVRDLMQGSNPSLAPYAKTGEVHLRLTARAPSAAEAAALLAPLESALRTRLGEVVYGSDDETLETVVVTALIAQKKTLATAESCTGGLVAERITRVPNASRVFSEGFITYSNEAKRKYLMVDEQVLAQHGAVSGETARAMAHGARAASGADFAVSVTGIAGPDGGTAEKPVGTVHIGFAWEEGETSQEHHFLGSRADVRLRSSQAALNRVRLFLQEGIDEGAPAKNFS